MPIQFKPKTKPEETERADESAKTLALFKDNDELTLAGRTVADFLEAADFDEVFASEAGQPYVVNPDVSEDDPYAVSEEGDGDDAEDKPEADTDADDEAPEADADDAEGDDDAEETTETALMPGVIAAQLVDEDDLTSMFGFYLGSIAASIDEANDGEEGLTERKAVMAVFRDVLEDDGTTIKPDRQDEVMGWLREMLEAGVVSTDELDEKFLTKSQRVKRAKIARKPKTGKKRAMLKKRRRERKKKKSKVMRQEKQFRRKRKNRIERLSKERSETEAPTGNEALIFGAGWGIDAADLLVGVKENAELDLSREQLVALDEMYGLLTTCEECAHEAATTAFIDEKKMKRKKDCNAPGGASYEAAEGDAVQMRCPECEHKFDGVDEKKKVPPAFLKKMKGKKGDKDADGDDDGSKKGEKSESTSPLATVHGSPFAVAAGRPNLSEGSSLAGSVLGVMGIGRPLND